ncbi:LacI family DNA-binding transcriptional regulator [Ruania alkalisoli]|uniref:LacI family DNA-binding transcriptional regulator n=1 Tax=Ruania alkalisoli TaxID=2779775 RepID=A0A7M1SWL8_9MICO|nr:LacI family DNA-binding transcriptional regulator [Ruania alkalisoli]QOR71945.1 LacI family DNA-binding transcriptional regulator [Ruania alkalisoli]
MPQLPSPAKPTIGDVAAKAGVTKATVSHAFSGRRPISEATKARVFAAAEELQWLPSASARALATSRANAIGIVLARDPEIIASDTFFPAFIAGVEAVLGKAEVALVLQVAGSRDAEERAYRAMASGRADGVIILDLHHADWRVPYVHQLGLHAVVLGAYDDPSPFTCVRTDDASPTTDLIEHLRSQGHTRIAHVAGPLDYVHSRVRARAYLSAVGNADLLAEGDFGAASGRDRTAELLALPDPPTAIVYANDTMAIAGLSYARSIGLSVPDDLAVAGFDDDHLSAHLSPALTTVATDPIERGRVCAEALLADIAGEPARTIQLDCNRLQLRASTQVHPTLQGEER